MLREERTHLLNIARIFVCIQCGNRFSSLQVKIPNAAFIYLQNNSFEDVILSTLLVSSPAVVNISQNSFACPYPEIGLDIVIIRDACIIDWHVFWVTLAVIVGSVSAFVLTMVGLAFFFCGQTQRESCMNPILLKKTLIRFLYGWSTATGGVLLSLLSLSDMLEFLNSDELNCVLLNKLWLPVNVYNRNNVPFVPDADTFADWLRAIQVFFLIIFPRSQQTTSIRCAIMSFFRNASTTMALTCGSVKMTPRT